VPARTGGAAGCVSPRQIDRAPVSRSGSAPHKCAEGWGARRRTGTRTFRRSTCPSSRWCWPASLAPSCGPPLVRRRRLRVCPFLLLRGLRLQGPGDGEEEGRGVRLPREPWLRRWSLSGLRRPRCRRRCAKKPRWWVCRNPGTQRASRRSTTRLFFSVVVGESLTIIAPALSYVEHAKYCKAGPADKRSMMPPLATHVVAAD
jgi:hypothetical protein